VEKNHEKKEGHSSRGLIAVWTIFPILELRPVLRQIPAR
jgi:hypothetical protein